MVTSLVHVAINLITHVRLNITILRYAQKVYPDAIQKKLQHDLYFMTQEGLEYIVAVAQRYEFVYSVKELRKLGFLHKKIAKNKMQVKSSLMPHQIRILDVRAERLQDITDEDCLKEGIVKYTKDKTVYKYDLDDGFEMFAWGDMNRTPQEAFASLIDKISGKGTWDSNSFVWRIEFEQIKTKSQ